MKLRADLFFPLRLTPRKYPTGGTIFMEQNMFCYQCQETAGCSGCTKSGVCGKRPETAALQDLLIWTTKGLSAVTTQLRREGKTVDASVNHLITENLFTTITNVNFDDDTIRTRIEQRLRPKRFSLSLPTAPLCRRPPSGTAQPMSLPQKQLPSAYFPRKMRTSALYASSSPTV